MKSIERLREDFANLLNDENRKSIIQEMYETGEIYDRADEIEFEKEYQNFKMLVEKIKRVRRIKNIKKWLTLNIYGADERMMEFIKKYLKENS